MDERYLSDIVVINQTDDVAFRASVSGFPSDSTGMLALQYRMTGTPNAELEMITIDIRLRQSRGASDLKVAPYETL